MVMDQKQCNKCELILPIDKFGKYSTNSGIKYRPQCEICRNQKYYPKINAKKRANYDPTKKHEYYLENKETITKRTNKRHIERRREDPLYKLADTIRRRTKVALTRKSWKKDTHFVEYIGCTLEELKSHLENQFTEGMTWNNHGKWHIDHIVPLASAKTPEEIYKLCHFSNLQPLWALDNIRKGDKIVPSNIITY
jgi:hypothetical protein